MKLKTIILSAFLISLCLSKPYAQELNLEVRINTPALKLADPKVIKTLETAIKEFYNNTSWTDDEFDDLERIEGTFQINIKDDIATNTFIADFYVTASRPVYGSNYYTTLLNHVDRSVTFSYEEYAPLFNSKNAFTDNLSAILTYYAYVIIGFDYDSFSAFGGDQYFQIANNIVASVPPAISSADKGWTAKDGKTALSSPRNRYWLVENVLSPRVRPYRRAFYEYHRQGLDKMSRDVEKSKIVLLSSLKTIGDVSRSYPDAMIIQMFTDSKKQEVLDVFTGAARGDRLKVYDIMTKLNPAQQSLYSDLRS